MNEAWDRFCADVGDALYCGPGSDGVEWEDEEGIDDPVDDVIEYEEEE